MVDIYKIAESEGIIIVFESGLHLVCYESFDKFASLAERLGLSIIGVDGYYKTEKGLMPIMDLIADFSGLDVNESIIEARHFVDTNMSAGVLIGVTFE